MYGTLNQTLVTLSLIMFILLCFALKRFDNLIFKAFFLSITTKLTNSGKSVEHKWSTAQI